MQCKNCGNSNEPHDQICVHCGVPLYAPPMVETKSKLIAGLLAIFLGSLGIHNFYLGHTNRGLVQILVSIIGGIVTCGIATAVIEVWALVEGIMILAGKVPVDARGIPLRD